MSRNVVGTKPHSSADAASKISSSGGTIVLNALATACAARELARLHRRVVRDAVIGVERIDRSGA